MQDDNDPPPDSHNQPSEKVVGNSEINHSLPPFWLGQLEKFARSTTGHGFARIVDRDEPFRLRVFWTLTVIVLAACLFTAIFIISYESLVLKGLRREFTVQHNHSLHLPDIHICDTSLFKRSALEGIQIYFCTSFFFFKWN